MSPLIGLYILNEARIPSNLASVIGLYVQKIKQEDSTDKQERRILRIVNLCHKWANVW